MLEKWPSHHLFTLTRQGIPTNMSHHSKYAVATTTTKVTTTLKTSSAAHEIHVFPAKKKGENVSYFSCGSHDGCVTLRPQVQEKQQAIMERTVKIADGGRT